MTTKTKEQKPSREKVTPDGIPDPSPEQEYDPDWRKKLPKREEPPIPEWRKNLPKREIEPKRDI